MAFAAAAFLDRFCGRLMRAALRMSITASFASGFRVSEDGCMGSYAVMGGWRACVMEDVDRARHGGDAETRFRDERGERGASGVCFCVEWKDERLLPAAIGQCLISYEARKRTMFP
ncbi:hypothetical protein R3P38DRAFT_2787418 [Favolaschia claudopus]|uniref:Uncharacterized protein n=1 Tax=Favolaschia claudopus TaxID=2862362 RepID=A0AAW0A418_9AGAR